MLNNVLHFSMYWHMFIIDFSKNLKTAKKSNLTEPLREKVNFLHKVSTGSYLCLLLISAKTTKNPISVSEPPWQKANFLHKVLAGIYEYLSLISAKTTKQQKTQPLRASTTSNQISQQSFSKKVQCLPMISATSTKQQKSSMLGNFFHVNRLSSKNLD